MNPRMNSALPALALSALAAIAAIAPARAAQAETAGTSFAITNVRIFDGEKVVPLGTVVVEGGKIRAAGPDVAVPSGTRVIDGTGATLLPGLIDSHSHTWGDALARALVFGVTTELDMFTTPDFARSMREEQAKTGAPGRADLYSAGILATAPGGHGTEYGLPVPTLTKPEEALPWVDARLAEGSDYIKIVAEDGSPYGMKTPTLDRATIAALVAAAHQRGKLAVVHVSTQRDAEMALEVGADGLVHIFTDRAPEARLAELARKGKAFVTPTLTVVESTTGTASGKSIATDPQLSPYLTQEEVDNLSRSFPDRGKLKLANALAAVRQLRDAGVPILAGTDAPNPGTAHGASLHRELELLVQAGLSPVQALAAATSAPAKAFRLADRGRIAPGLRADLVLVQGDPTQSIAATRAILHVWKQGAEVPRVKVERTASGAAPKPQVDASGAISDFEDGTPSTRFGGGWIASTDQMAGGKSEVQFAVVEGGAKSARALELTGEIKPGFAYPWAGVMFSPGAVMMAAADLSGFSGVELEVKGDGRSANLLVFAQHLGRMPAQKSFTAGPEWTRVKISFADLGIDGSDVMGIFVGGGQPAGAFKLLIDDVRLTPKP